MDNSVDMFGFNDEVDEVDEFNEETTNFQVKIRTLCAAVFRPTEI
jgi:hypothetical protein